MKDVYSKFYYGLDVNEFSYTLAFDEGSGTLIAEVRPGLYTPTQLGVQIARALNQTGLNEYGVVFNRSTRKFTITCDVTFKILGATGGDSGTSILNQSGFDSVDTGFALSHESDNAVGIVYSPQFWLQAYTPSQHFQGAAFSTVNKAASGKVQVQNFGREYFTKFNITMINEIEQGASPIRTNKNALSEIIQFMEWVSIKAPVEFMYDESDPEEFETMILESGTSGSDGTGFELKELYDRGFTGYYETGILRFRRVD